METLTDDRDRMLGQVFVRAWCHDRVSDSIAEGTRDTGNIDRLRVAQYLKRR